jgi:hypothetical protein
MDNIKASTTVRKAAEKGDLAGYVVIQSYVSSASGEVANITVDTRADYLQLIKASIQQVTAMKPADLQRIAAENNLAPELVEQARTEVLASLEQSLKGENPHGVIVKASYEDMGQGVKVHKDSGAVHLQGLQLSKQVLLDGTPKAKVNSKPLTIAKDAIRDTLPVHKWRQYKLESGRFRAIQIGDKTFSHAAFRAAAAASKK